MLSQNAGTTRDPEEGEEPNEGDLEGFGPYHDGEAVFDRRYVGGSWDLLSISGVEGLTLLGFSVDPMEITRDDGSKKTVQGGMYLMSRGTVSDYRMVIGGGA